MAIVKLTLFQFNMGDVEDPQLYAAAPLYDWEQTEYGKWCKKHCEHDSLVWNIFPCVETYGYRCKVTGELEEKLVTFHQLKWGGHVNFN